MSTTTIRLSDDLKARVVSAAEQSGLSAHGFILEAVAEKTAQVEARAAFHALATQRLAAFARTGRSVPFEDMQRYVSAKVAGQPAKPPRARKTAVR
ncbi:MAG: DUF1778 domain-containing protein [Vitreoscilla sp.]|nr:DUF1778 domain-containing protein [Vitreoscilla sp.]